MQIVWDALKARADELAQQGLSNEEIEKRLSELDFTKIVSQLTEEMASDYVDFFEKSMYEMVLEERAMSAEFIARNEQIWSKGFVASEVMYLITVESADSIGEYMVKQPEGTFKDRDYRCFVLRELHGRACQQYLEILCLIKAGFADGAYARWRSLYELSVIAEFISNNSEEVAKAYYSASTTESNGHNWAKEAPCFSNVKGNITFSMLQRQCPFADDAWNSQYKLANKIVHGTPQGTFGRLCVGSAPINKIPAGRSDYGLGMPAVNAAISLSMISASYFKLILSGDAIAYMQTLHKWTDIIRKIYSEIDTKCFNYDAQTECSESSQCFN